MTLKEAVSLVKTSLENTAIATVKSLKSHVFKVDIGKKEFAVANWPKKQVVEGKVAVVDLEKLEKQLVKIAEWQKNLEKSLRDLSNKDTVKVANFPKIPEFPQFPTSTKLAGEVKVSSGSFSSLLKAIEGLSELVAKLPTYYPEVKIPPFPKVEIPPFPKIPEPLSEVSIKNLEKLISKDPQRYVPVRLSDGKRFYQAIEELTVSASRAQAFSDSKGVRQQALVDEDRHVQVDVLTLPSVELEAKDIQIGAVEIKDSDTDSRATVGENGLEVEVKKSALPNGAATSAKQDTAKGVLDNIKTNTDNLTADPATSAKQDDIITAIDGLVEIAYEYMGKQTSGDYEYMGFKENGGTNWKVIRKDTTDDSAWAYCYGTSGWTTAWADPTALSFDDPPDSCS